MDLFEFLVKVKGLSESKANEIQYSYYYLNYIPDDYYELILEWYDFNFSP